MPLEDAIISHNKDGSPNEDYCKWCYADGTYTYSSMDDLIDACVRHMTNEHFTEEQARAYMRDLLPTLDYWKRYDELSDNGQFEAFKRQLIQEINDLHVEGLPKVEKLNALVGRYVNLAYPLPSGAAVNFLNDQTTYLGTQLESEFGGERCFGVLAGMDFFLISTYGPGAKPRNWCCTRSVKTPACRLIKSRNTRTLSDETENQSAFYLPRQDFLFRMKSLKSS